MFCDAKFCFGDKDGSGINRYFCDVIQKSMAANLQQRIEKIEAKAALMVERYEYLRQAKAAADDRIASLEETLGRLRREIADRDREIERLKIVTVLSPDHADVEATRALLTGLVREIDKCINKLSL